MRLDRSAAGTLDSGHDHPGADTVSGLDAIPAIFFGRGARQSIGKDRRERLSPIT
jgi:hypothetical protein